MDAKLEMKIPEVLITDTIRAEIVRQIPNKEGFVAAVIKQMLGEKADRYDSRTRFQVAVADMINAEAKAVFKEWLEANRVAVRAALIKELTNSKAKRLKQIAENLADGLLNVDARAVLSIRENE